MKKLALLFVFVNYLIFAQGEQRYADGTATDQDGNTFEWISYGYGENSFHWAIENADVVTYNDGTPIPQVLYPTQWSNASGAWCYYNNDPTQVRLYNWAAVTHPRFAPEGWRVASKDDYTLLTDYLENNNYIIEGGIGKAMASTTGWDSSTTGGAPGNDQNLNNRSGFNALPGPYRFSNGDFISGGGYSARFWTSTNYEGGVIDYDAYIFIIGFSSPSISVGRTDKRRGVSVRFVRDAPNDTEAPVITLLGANLFQINQGAVYNDPGATAYDNVDGDISQNIVTNPVNLNTSEAGTFTITYSVSDAAGNSAIPKTRTVNVLDTEPPVITLLGSNTIAINQGDTYIDPGATAYDNVDTNVTFVEENNVNTNTPGTYSYIYTATDSAGNTSTVTRTVIVLDTEPPVITLNGANSVTIDQGEVYTDQGATATDNVDGGLTNSIIIDTSALDTSVPGTYTVTYSVTDSAGNTSTATRTVNVIENPTVNAGPDLSVCQGEQVTLGEATASNYSSLQWTTNGSGTITNAYSLTPTYTPSAADANVAVFLTLTANGTNGEQTASDTAVIYIEQDHIIQLTSSNSDQIVDEGTLISPITFSLGGGATSVTVYGLPRGISLTVVDGGVTISGTPSDDITQTQTYTYTVTTTGNGCTPITYSGTITVNPVQTNPTETGILLNGIVSAENNQIKNVADPTDAQDAVTKTFIENFIKNSVSMEFFEWNISKVNADNQTIQLSSKTFVFVNAANTTIILPDESQVSEMDVIYIYSLRGTNNAPIEDCAITFTSNSHPISSYKLGDGLITASVGQKIYGRFPSSGLKTIVFIDGQWFIGNFSPYSILD